MPTDPRGPSLADIGRRSQTSFAPAPLSLPQLHPGLTIPRAKRPRAPKDHKPREVPLRFLLRVDHAVKAESLRREVRRCLGGGDAAGARGGRLVDDLRLEEVVSVAGGKRRWWSLALPVSLGSFVADTGMDFKQLQGLAKGFGVIPGVDSVEVDVPHVNAVVPQQEFLPGCTVGRAQAPADNFWSQRLINLLDAADARRVAPTGAGITLGLIDTGYTTHSELNVPATFDLNASTSVIDGGNGRDPMTSGTSHGTATGSLITSGHRTADVADRVAGIAPQITVVAVRALDFVIVLPFGADAGAAGQLVGTFLVSDILAAMQHCLDAGCQVLSMSFGGVVSHAVRDIIEEAYQRDVIMCAAAGNCVRVVVEPAARPQVIACAGAGLDRGTGQVRPWPGTSRGPRVDISAPAENVYIADWDAGTQVVRPGEGTSFAAPQVAAAAALWLERHGADALKARYQGVARLGDVFRSVLQASATVPSGWDTRQFGAGILNVLGLLEQPLPKSARPRAEPASASPCEAAAAIADLLLTDNRIPLLASTVRVRVDVARIEVRDDGESFGGSEPYLLETFYRIDGRKARAELVVDASTLETDGILNGTFSILRRDPAESFVHIRQRGGHGSLPEVNIGALEYNFSGPVVINVDNDVGRWDTSVKPIPLRLLINLGSLIVGKDVVGVPGFVGALTMLLEEDSWSESIVQNLKTALRTHTRSAIEGVLRELSFSVSLADLRLSLPQIDAERIALEVEDQVRQSVARNANLWDALLAGVDGDDLLIQDFTMANVLQLGDPVPIAPPEANDGNGRWLLRGSIRKRT